jgi:Type IX secretion system protein PorV
MYRYSFMFLAFLGTAISSFGQLGTTNGQVRSTWQLNTITTAVPFLQITPDSRSGAMGDAGVALSPDANSTFWNAAKMAFATEDMELSMSYSPWLRALVNDMSLAYLSGYSRLSKNQTVGGSLRYFTLGNITFTDEVGTVIRDFKPNEFALDGSFGQKFSDKLAGGIAIRYIYSNLTGGQNVLGADSKPGMAVAADISMFYTNDKMKIGGKDARLNIGGNISNIGNKMRYTNSDKRDFIPTNLKLGTAYTVSLDKFNDITVTLDLNKLLVPTPPRYTADGDSLLAGKDPNVGTATAMVQSFYDAPGDVDNEGNIISGSVVKEELREINIGGGFEYWYDQQFAFRTGYFYENYTKGNRQFITLGAGVKYQVITIDMSYLISTTQQNPLANTLRFTLRFALGANSGNSDEEPTE